MRTTLIKKGIREIWAHKVQYLFLILILGLGVAAYGSLNDMQASRYDTFDRNYEECRFQDLRTEFQFGVKRNLSEVSELINSEEMADRIEAIDYRLTFSVFLNHTDEGSYKLTKGRIMGYQYFSNGEPREIAVNRPLPYGDYRIEFDQGRRDQVYVEHNFALAYGLGKGDEIKVIQGENVTRVEVLDQISIPEYFLVMKDGSFLPQERSLGVLVVPMETAMDLLGSEARLVDSIAIRLKDGEDVASFEENLTTLLESNGIPVRTIEKEEDLARMMIKDDMEGDNAAFQTFPVIIFTVSGFGLFMALRRMVQTHKVQIGIFKSLGVPDRIVLFYFASIGLMVAVLGVVLGLILSVPLNVWFLDIVQQFFGFPILVYETQWRFYITGALLSLAICFACTVIPAWTALKVKPVDAIQSREGISKRKVGRIATHVGRKGNIPTPLKLSVRNFLRKPGRSITSVLGIGLSLSLFLSFMIIMQTMVVLIDQWNGVNRWDYEVEAEGFYPVNMTAIWRMQDPEITEVNAAMVVPTYLHTDDDEVGSIIYAVEDLASAYEIVLGSGEVRPGEIVISFYHRDELGLDIGDIVQIDVPVVTPDVGLVVTTKGLRVCGIQENHMGFYAFMDLGTMQNLTHLEGLANVFFLKTIDGERSVNLENTLIGDPGVSSVMHRSQIGNIVEEYFDLFMGVVYVISLISTALAAAIIYNLFMISVQEKRRDYATMKTLGTSLSRIARLLFFEVTFITIPGIAIGAIGGWLLAYYMIIVSMNVEGIKIILEWSWIGFLMGSTIMVVTVFLVSLVTLRYISKIIIANVIRERSTG